MFGYRAIVDAYLEKYPYQVVEFRSNGTKIVHWEGSFNCCKWWKNCGELEELGIDLDRVAIVPTTHEYAMAIHGFGYEMAIGKITPDMYC